MALVSNNAVNTAVTASTTAQNAIEASSGRLGFLITNNGSEDVYVAFGETATTSNGHKLAAGQSVTEKSFGYVFNGLISVITASGTSALVVTEFK